MIQSLLILVIPCIDLCVLKTFPDSAPRLMNLLKSPGAFTMRSSGEIEHFPADQQSSTVGDRLLQILLSAKVKSTVKSHPKGTSGKEAQPKPPICTYLASAEERSRSGYPDSCKKDGWVSTAGVLKQDEIDGSTGSSDPDHAYLVGLDCEMVQTTSGLVLARVSVVDTEGAVLYDTLVHPREEVTDYLTEFSGITAEQLCDVHTSLSDVQSRLLEILSEKSIIVGHSLENDLAALKLFHDRVIDTALIYPHSNGWPHRNGLASLSSRLLHRQLKRHGGHDSIADARTSLELALLKFQKGPSFGVSAEVSIPLGRALRASDTTVSVFDTSRHEDSSGEQPWHLLDCNVVFSKNDSDVAGAAAASLNTCIESCTSSGSTPPSCIKEVRIAFLREYEHLCKKRACCTTNGKGASIEAETAACLSRLDDSVSQAASKLKADDCLLVMSGAGNWHALRKLQKAGVSEDDNDFMEAQRRFKSGIGVVLSGGVQLQELLRKSHREIVSYDI